MGDCNSEKLPQEGTGLLAGESLGSLVPPGVTPGGTKESSLFPYSGGGNNRQKKIGSLENVGEHVLTPPATVSQVMLTRKDEYVGEGTSSTPDDDRASIAAGRIRNRPLCPGDRFWATPNAHSETSADEEELAQLARVSPAMDMTKGVKDARKRRELARVSPVMDVTKYLKDGRKRLRSGATFSGSDEDGTDKAPEAKISVSKRGKGKGKGRGRTAELSLEDKKALINARKEELRLQAEEEVTNLTLSIQSRASSNMSLVSEPEEEGEEAALATDLKNQVADSLAVINTVATKSGNLKGTFTKALKEATSAIAKAVEVLVKRTSSEEVVHLRAENARIKSEMAELRREFDLLRSNLEQARAERLTPQPSAVHPVDHQPVGEEFRASIISQIGFMMDAKLQGLEGRLLPEKRLRPPLRADISRPASVDPDTPTPVESETAPPKRAPLKGKGRGKAPAQRPAPTPAPTPASTPVPTPTHSRPRAVKPQSQPTATGTEWATVVRRGKKARGTPVTASSQPQPVAAVPAGPSVARRKKRVKLRSPASSAVVITLQPEAAERGITYAKVLAEAKTKIQLQDLGIGALRFRRSVVGASVLEVPGASSGEKADVLAEKLREALNSEEVRVSRPLKSAELRISELDDSVTSEEVAAAVAQHGGCSLESVKTGPIRRAFKDSGTVWVRCPVAAAKKLSSGRLMVGWVSAHVSLLTSRPMQCYRCHQMGHVKTNCPSEVDRSSDCYRCGVSGHQARSCSAPPRCPLCAAAKQPATHTIGSKACAEAKASKSKAKRKTTQSQNAPVSAANAASETERVEETMET